MPDPRRLPVDGLPGERRDPLDGRQPVQQEALEAGPEGGEGLVLPRVLLPGPVVEVALPEDYVESREVAEVVLLLSLCTSGRDLQLVRCLS